MKLNQEEISMLELKLKQIRALVASINRAKAVFLLGRQEKLLFLEMLNPGSMEEKFPWLSDFTVDCFITAYITDYMMVVDKFLRDINQDYRMELEVEYEEIPRTTKTDISGEY